MASYDDEELKETTLSPEVRRIRNSIIQKFAQEPLEIMAKFVKDVVENETDSVRRLGAMAARVEILRMRISQISDDSTEPNFENVLDEETEEADSSDEVANEIVITSPNLSDWVRLRIIENSEINGVRFPKGVVIDVSQEDGDRLLESGKASYVEEDEIADVKSDVSLKVKNNADSAGEIKETPTEALDEDEGLEDDQATSGGTLDLEASDVIAEEEPKKEETKSKRVKKKSEEIIDPIESDLSIAESEPLASIKVDSPDDMLAGFATEETDTSK